MKKLLCLFLFLTFTQTVFARDLVVALSPHQAPEEAKAYVKSLIPFLVSLDENDQVIFLDGYHLKTISKFIIPAGKTYHSPKARLAKNRKALAGLIQFSKSVSLPNGNLAPSVTQAVRLPQLLRHVAENYRPQDKLDVLVLGSPIYDDPKEPALSFVDAALPSDGHLKASRNQSPFGTKDMPDVLKNITLHLAFESEDIFINDQHRYLLKRFWSLYLSQQGGILASFTADKTALFERIKSNIPAIKDNFTLGKETALEMIRISTSQSTTSIYERTISERPLAQHKIRTAHNVTIGLSWDCETCDLDLYARPFIGAEVLYFNHSTSDQGVHWKDYKSSPKQSRAFETIEFKVPLDLRQLQIVVNFYKGSAPQGVKAKLRLSVDGQVFAKSFVLKATAGNKSKGVRETFRIGRSPNSAVRTIDPLLMVNHQ